MSRKSATDLIRQLNPKNTSGTIPQALQLVESLQRSSGNPSMSSAVGPRALVEMLQFVLNQHKRKSPYQANTANTQIQETLIQNIQQNPDPNFTFDSVIELSDSSSSEPTVVLVSEGTWSSVSELVFTGLSATYAEYKLYVENLIFSEDDTTFFFEFSSNSGATFYTTPYSGLFRGEVNWENSPGVWFSNEYVWDVWPDSSTMELLGHLESAKPNSFQMTIVDPTAALPTGFYCDCQWWLFDDFNFTIPRSGNLPGRGSYMFLDSVAMNAFRLRSDRGSFSGSYKLYGLKG